MRQDDWQKLQEENADLRQEVTLLRALVAELLPLKTQVEELTSQVKQLQSQQAKDSHNSHLPPSSDRFSRAAKTKSLRKRSGKEPGAQPGHEGNTLYQVSSPDQIIVHAVEVCAGCEQSLGAIPALAVERRQVIDLPVKRVVVVEHQAQQKQCPACGAITKADFPQGIEAPVQYGPAFGAIGVYLTHQQHLPYQRACETMQDLLGPAMSVGTLAGLVQRCATHLKPVEEQIKAHLSQAPVMHQDESGLYVMGKRLWMHVATTPTLTHYAVHAKRGSEALDAIGIMATFTGVSVHDGWSPYWRYGGEHALCNVHHLRELTFVQEEQQQDWAAKMITLLTQMNAAVTQRREAGHDRLEPTVLADYHQAYQALLQEGWQANPPDPPASQATITRGRRKQSPARNLLHRLEKHQDAVLLFLERFDVPFDNSRAERDIRMVKVQQKISGCFRSLLGAEAFCRIRGYISTLRKQGVYVLTALEQALAGHPLLPSF